MAANFPNICECGCELGGSNCNLCSFEGLSTEIDDLIDLYTKFIWEDVKHWEKFAAELREDITRLDEMLLIIDQNHFENEKSEKLKEKILDFQNTLKEAKLEKLCECDNESGSHCSLCSFEGISSELDNLLKLYTDVNKDDVRYIKDYTTEMRKDIKRLGQMREIVKKYHSKNKDSKKLKGEILDFQNRLKSAYFQQLCKCRFSVTGKHCNLCNFEGISEETDNLVDLYTKMETQKVKNPNKFNAQLRKDIKRLGQLALMVKEYHSLNKNSKKLKKKILDFRERLREIKLKCRVNELKNRGLI